MTAPTDSGFFLSVTSQRRERARRRIAVTTAVAVGGALGSAARYGASLAWPTAQDTFPWTTFAVNATGCAVIGAFLVIINDAWSPHWLVRPFFGTGVLGGFTTFSTYAVDIQRLVQDGQSPIGLAYLAATVLAAFVAVWCAAAATRRLVSWRQR
ncbi:fluoride efflux transporter FluC [Streptomyces umbrinus]|nr:CrcB family protein [Streptomyces umbrinus]